MGEDFRVHEDSTDFSDPPRGVRVECPRRDTGPRRGECGGDGRRPSVKRRERPGTDIKDRRGGRSGKVIF